MKFKKIAFILSLLLVVVLLAQSCALFNQSPLIKGGQVITTSDNIVPTYEGDLFVYPPDQLPQELQDKWQGETLVIAPKEVLKDPENSYVSLDPKDYDGGEASKDAVWFGWDIAKIFFPGLLAWESVLGLLIPRKRVHYSAMITALNPMSGGSVDIKSAVVSLSRGLGITHSSVASGEVFKDEEAAREKDIVKVASDTVEAAKT